jgi:hypothetical protein
VATKGAIEVFLGGGGDVQERKIAQNKKDSDIRSETEEVNKEISQGFGPKKGAHDGTRTHVGMSKRWTCTTKNRKAPSTSQQASCACNRAQKSYTHRDGAQGRTPHGRIYPKRRDRAASHRSWAADIKIDRATEGTQGTAPRGREHSPNGAETATQSDMGADLGESTGWANERGGI